MMMMKAILVSVRWKAPDVFLVEYQKPFYLYLKRPHAFSNFSFIPVWQVYWGATQSPEQTYLSMKFKSQVRTQNCVNHEFMSWFKQPAHTEVCMNSLSILLQPSVTKLLMISTRPISQLSTEFIMMLRPLAKIIFWNNKQISK